MRWSLCNKNELEEIKRGTIISIVPEGLKVERREVGANLVLKTERFISQDYKYPSEIIADLAYYMFLSAGEVYVDECAYKAICSICEVNRVLY